jgi:hypothetical protein
MAFILVLAGHKSGSTGSLVGVSLTVGDPAASSHGGVGGGLLLVLTAGGYPVSSHRGTRAGGRVSCSSFFAGASGWVTSPSSVHPKKPGKRVIGSANPSLPGPLAEGQVSDFGIFKPVLSPGSLVDLLAVFLSEKSSFAPLLLLVRATQRSD